MDWWLTRTTRFGSPMRPLNRIGASSSRSWAWTSRRASLPPPECRWCAARPAVSWKRSRIPPSAKAIAGLISFGVAGGLASHLRRRRLGRGFVDSRGADRPRHGCGVVAQASWPRRWRHSRADPRRRFADRRAGQKARALSDDWRCRSRYGVACRRPRCRTSTILPLRRCASWSIPRTAQFRRRRCIDMRPDGRPNVPAMLRNIAARPSQLSRLARIAVDAFTARAAMNRVRRGIGPHFGLMDL